MGAKTAIEWCHHTFNPWRGCEKVSPGCANCYAEATSKRNPKVLGEWGPDTRRAPASEGYWRQPLSWNREAEKAGERHRVFCASLADVFEEREDLEAWRQRLFELIEKTTHLDWLLLTKRPDFAADWLRERYETAGSGPLPNLWLGTSVEDQKRADERIPELLRAPAAVRFLSCEPLLEEVDLRGLLRPRLGRSGECPRCGFLDSTWGHARQCTGVIDWVIVGGESGSKARPVHPDWVRLIRDQCQWSGAAFFFKQWGAWAPRRVRNIARGSKAGSIEPWTIVSSTERKNRGARVYHAYPRNLELDQNGFADYWLLEKAGKKAAGRLLDGRTWDELPGGGS